MRLLFNAGLLLLAVQATVQVISGQTLNPDDNRSVQEVSSEYVRTNGFETGNQNDRQVSKATNNLNGYPISTGEASPEDDWKEKLTTVSAEASRRHVMTESKDTKTSVPELKPESFSSEVVSGTDKPKRATEGDVIADSSVVASSKETNDSNKETTTKKLTKPKSYNFVFPDHIESYSNDLMLEGHLFGISDDVMAMIHAALSSDDIFVPVDPLRVYQLTNSFQEMGYEGTKVTHIRYIVSYKGQPIHTHTISWVMRHPKVSNHFKSQLEGKNIRQYKEAKPLQNKSWIHQHLAAIVIPSCVAFVLIILAISIVVARKRSSAATKSEKKTPPTSSANSEKKCPPPPYSVVNPAYEFETNAVMDGYSLP